jgi:hypothetical protein
MAAGGGRRRRKGPVGISEIRRVGGAPNFFFRKLNTPKMFSNNPLICSLVCLAGGRCWFVGEKSIGGGAGSFERKVLVAGLFSEKSIAGWWPKSSEQGVGSQL